MDFNELYTPPNFWVTFLTETAIILHKRKPENKFEYLHNDHQHTRTLIRATTTLRNYSAAILPSNVPTNIYVLISKAKWVSFSISIWVALSFIISSFPQWHLSVSSTITLVVFVLFCKNHYSVEWIPSCLILLHYPFNIV